MAFDSHQEWRIRTEPLPEEGCGRFGTTQGKPLIVFGTADGIGVTGNGDGVDARSEAIACCVRLLLQKTPQGGGILRSDLTMIKGKMKNKGIGPRRLGTARQPGDDPYGKRYASGRCMHISR